MEFAQGHCKQKVSLHSELKITKQELTCSRVSSSHNPPYTSPPVNMSYFSLVSWLKRSKTKQPAMSFKLPC